MVAPHAQTLILGEECVTWRAYLLLIDWNTLPTIFFSIPSSQSATWQKFSDVRLGFGILDNTHNVEVEFGPNRSIHQFFLGKPQS